MKKLITYLLFLLPVNGSFAQQNLPPPGPLDGLDLEALELPNGEPGNHVQAIVQDRYGFMWFGSQYGLHRWDGNQFKTYLHNPSNSQSISSDYVESIFTAKDGTLWIGTWGSGLNHFDQRTDKFTRYYQGRRDGLSSNFINAIAEDDNGNIWVGTQDGLDRLDPRTGDIAHFRNIPGDKRSLSCNQVRSLLVDSQGTLWVGTGFFFDDSKDGGLNRFDAETADFTQFLSKKGDVNGLSGNEVRAIFEDSKGNLWVGTDGDGLHLMNREAGTFKRFRNTSGENSLSSPRPQWGWDAQVTFILEDTDGRIWLGNWGGGIKCYDPAIGKARMFNTNGKNGSHLLENNAWAGFQSKDGVLWFSTASDGAKVYRTAGKRGLFNSVYLPTKTDIVKSFGEDANQNIYFSTNQNLVGKLNLSANHNLDDKIPPPANPAGAIEYLSQATALAGAEKIVKDVKGLLWGMKPSGGLVRYDPVKKTVKQFVHQASNPRSLPAAPVLDILPDKKGNLWLATFGNGLVFFDQQSEEFTALRSKKGNENSLPHDYAGKLFLDERGFLWVTGGGKDKEKEPFYITRFDPATRSFTRYQINGIPDYSNLWRSPPAQDKAGNIWVCLDAGLLKLNPASGECSFFDQKRLGQKGSPLKGMVMDNDGRLWIMSEKLLAFDPMKETVFSYGVGSGLRVLPFEQDAIYKNDRGDIFLGGRNGFHFFNPRQLDSMNMTPPAVRVTGFELLDTDGPESLFDATVMQGKPISLGYDQNVFSFSFSALDFTDPAANRLEYMLENFDEDWRVAGQDLKATYVKVPPGTYRFRVRGANSFGVWGEETSVQMAISPPWWLTWWSWALYGLFVAGAIFMAYRFLLNRRMERSETLRLKELDNAKNRLFANITHEFRTPLTIILGMAEQLAVGSQQLAVEPEEKDKINSGLEMIQRNGTNLLGLVNQMLELAKMEDGAVRLNLTQGDVVGYLKYVTNNFQSLATDKHLGLHFLSDIDELTMDYDAEKLQRVLSNLLSNALKFTPAGGNVYVTVSGGDLTNFKNLSNLNTSLTIKVRDTGPGIPQDKLPHIFNRFFQATESAQYQGSGIGLALTQEFVKLMGGEIGARSRDGEGAEFVVSLPVKALPHPAPKVKEQSPGTMQAKPTLIAPSFEEDLGAPNVEVASSPVSIFSSGGNVDGVVEKDADLPLLLLIEDNPDVMTHLKFCLSGRYRLAAASNGQEGVELATQLVPDLVVTDVMMPVMDGYEVCRFSKNDERTSHIPVIMLTAKVGFESRLEGLEMGADAYLAKPFHREELLVQIKNLLEVRRRLQKHYRNVAGISAEQLFPIQLIKSQWDKQATPEMKEAEDYFVKKVRRAVEARLDDADFNVEELCKEIGMSHSHLHRKLSALTGCSASKFIRHIRLSKAKELLENHNLTITAVAFDTGFNDPGYFGRVFKQEFGMTPVEWRERMVGIAN